MKDSREQLRSTRARATSNATTDSTPSIAPGRSFTVANINNGIIYLRYVCRVRTAWEDECGGKGGGEAGGLRPVVSRPSKSKKQAGRQDAAETGGRASLSLCTSSAHQLIPSYPPPNLLYLALLIYIPPVPLLPMFSC